MFFFYYLGIDPHLYTLGLQKYNFNQTALFKSIQNTKFVFLAETP